MNFKEQLQKDISIFINQNEFAEKHFIEDVEMDVIIDVQANSNFEKAAELQAFQEGIYQSKFKIMYASTREELPRQGYKMKFDGIDYDVVSAEFEDGMSVVTLLRNEG